MMYIDCRTAPNVYRLPHRPPTKLVFSIGDVVGQLGVKNPLA